MPGRTETNGDYYYPGMHDGKPFFMKFGWGDDSELDVRDLEYVHEPNPNLVCEICGCPFVKPMITPCGHAFCMDCFEDHLDATSDKLLDPECPKCRLPLFARTLLQPTEKIMPVGTRSCFCLGSMADELLVYCPKRDRGCQVQLPREKMADHAKLCVGRPGLIETISAPKDPTNPTHYEVSWLALVKRPFTWDDEEREETVGEVPLKVWRPHRGHRQNFDEE